MRLVRAEPQEQEHTVLWDKVAVCSPLRQVRQTHHTGKAFGCEGHNCA
jgi:hypothetical protein